MNKDLYGKQYKVPTNILNHLKNYSNNESIGNILSNGNVSYSQMKKLKHRIENGEKKELGEDTFYNWIKQNLDSDRGSIQTSKRVKSDTGMQNQFINPHEKQGFSNHNKTNADVEITEALKRINQIMSKII